ncbi:MAG: GTP 3',8-cyclase MoaA [Ardenticatenia bacterium]|nr:MAG: GTP 3',8-cyclase MoaA [Ardenticatenia bacterium]
MEDRFGRVINYLRFSVTDRCNLRCRYCMPEGKDERKPRARLLTVSEIEKVVRAAVQVGIRKIRLTGGEPTLRSDILEIVHRLSSIPGVEELVMTTNAMRLTQLAVPLREAGLCRVNIHLDSLDGAHVRALTGKDCLNRVWDGIVAAEQAGLLPIKLNVVVVRGYNECDVVEMARLTLRYPWQVRFIELMPLGEPAHFAMGHYVASQETRMRIEAMLGPLTAEPAHEGDVDISYRLAGAKGRLEFISPVSHAYCHRCNHIRVTADGRIRLCLLRDDEWSLHEGLRSCDPVGTLAELFSYAIQCKPHGSQLAQGIFPTSRPMAGIGG